MTAERPPTLVLPGVPPGSNEAHLPPPPKELIVTAARACTRPPQLRATLKSNTPRLLDRSLRTTTDYHIMSFFHVRSTPFLPFTTAEPRANRDTNDTNVRHDAQAQALPAGLYAHLGPQPRGKIT